MGMKHCGKSTVGALLAKSLSLPFFDLDALLLAESEGGGGPPGGIEGIFRRRGPETFFRLEADAFGSICSSAPPGGFVLALGGRAPLNPFLAGALEQCGVLVYINTPFATIRRRILARGTSVLLDGADPEKTLRSLYDERHPVYVRLARLVVDGSGSPEEIAGRIEAGLRKERTYGG
ncbi:MAG: hypothetical protein JXD23_02000 [Spirochaetales bacterium]|nr:hypothetical protein [Spirochaetales bacterium]